MPNLLLVDDDASIRESLREYLNSQGHQLSCASSLPEAIQMAEDIKPDAVVSDLLFGQGNGLMLKNELSRRFGSDGPGFILMTGHASLDTALEALNAGVDQYLLKPLNLESLSRAIDLSVRKRAIGSPALRVKFQAAEHFYHDLSLPLNLLIPRLAMLLEGRPGPLTMAQVQNVSQQFTHLRHILWLMKGFYPRLLEGGLKAPAKSVFDADVLVADLLRKLGADLNQRQVAVEYSRAQPGQKVFASEDSASTLIEIVLTRASAIAEAGSRLSVAWASVAQGFELRISMDFSSAQGPGLAALIPLVPFSQTRLEYEGLEFYNHGPAGPWFVRFEKP